MANFSVLFLIFGLFFFLHPFQLSNAHKFNHFHSLKRCHFDKIYQLGDSLSDTGNLIRESPTGSHSPFAMLPYGETSFRNATGRCSNGLLMIDFFALSAGLPLLKPYKEAEANFEHGVNFAVAGSTALPVQILAAMNIFSPVTTSSLDVQLDWMHSHFNSTCQNQTECEQKNVNSLFMVGEIGGNDYNYALFQRKSIQELREMVPQVVATISNAVRSNNQFWGDPGSRTWKFTYRVSSDLPYRFQTNDSNAYDDFHCLKGLNNFSIYHNKHLQQAIEELKIQYPKTTILYGDYHNSFLWVLSRARFLGFNLNSLQKACCGSGGAYNFNLTNMCGAPGATVCPNPYSYMSWDGVHLTQHAYKLMARWLIRNMLTKLQCQI